MQNNILETVEYAMVVVQNPKSFYDDHESRLMAWNTLMIARGRKMNVGRVFEMQQSDRDVA